MQFDNLPDWLHWLESLHPKTIELGLDRLRQVAGRMEALDVLNAPDRPLKIVTVAGTNGKGSCVATVEKLCLASGQSVGAYTSPHFLRYNERIRINGSAASDEQIMAAFEEVDRARGDISLTYFEFGTLAALLLFVRAGVENLLLEVGLGGRLDGVNLVDSDVAVVTSIDLDHQDWLGDNREAIGREKAGVFRGQRPAICVDPDPPESLLQVAAESGANLLLAGSALQWFEDSSGWTWLGRDAAGETVIFSGLPVPRLPLPSVAAAVQAFLLLGNSLDRDRLADVLDNLSLPGRCQRLVYRGRQILLDVAHNPAAADYLAARLSSAGPLRAVFAVMADKDYRNMLASLGTAVDYWYVCGLPDNPRAARAGDLLTALQDLGLAGQSCDTVKHGFAQALASAEEGDQILVAGSFFTVAEVLAVIDDEGQQAP